MAEQKSVESRQHDRVTNLFRSSRFEVIPFVSMMNKLEHIPDNTTLTVTCSPNKSIAHTLEMAKNILELSINVKVVPHIAARMIEDESHIDTILDELEKLGIDDIFMPGGDINPAKGPFHSASDVLTVLAKKSHHLNQIGITGYPEGHALIADDVLWDNLVAKSNYAHYIVTQLCFEPNTILQWIRQLRQHDITLPVYVGVPGMVDRKKLLEMSLRLGIGESINFLKKQNGFFKQLFRFKSIRSSAEPIIKHLMMASKEEELNLAGFHVYTFNQLEPTFLWWHKLTNLQERTNNDF